jgi:hypothetical protein
VTGTVYLMLRTGVLGAVAGTGIVVVVVQVGVVAFFIRKLNFRTEHLACPHHVAASRAYITNNFNSSPIIAA